MKKKKTRNKKERKKEQNIEFQYCLPELVLAFHSLLLADSALPLALMYMPALQDIFL